MKCTLTECTEETAMHSMETTKLSSRVFTVLKAVCDCSTAFYAYVDEAPALDESASLLHDQVNNLQRSIASVDSALREPSLKQHDDLPLWRSVGESISECQSTMDQLTRRLREVCQANVADALLLPPEEMNRIRAQVQMHQSAMHVILQVTATLASGTVPQLKAEQLDPRVEVLADRVTILRSSASAAEEGSADTTSTHERLAQAAMTVASRARAISSSKSTAWFSSTSQPDVKHLEVPKSAKRSTMTTTIGSELGEPLSEEARKRISVWMAQGDAPVPPVPQHPLLPVEKGLADAELAVSPKTEYPPLASNLLAAPVDSDDILSDDEDEMEIEVTQQYLREGRIRAEAGNYQQAEAFLRKGLAKAMSLTGKPEGISTSDITLEIARACFEQDQMAEALQLTDQLVRQTPEDDRDRVRLLTASHLRAQVLLRQGLFDSASRQCKKTLHGRRRLGGKDSAYYESVALLAAIYEAQGDEIEALTYASFLPSDFAKPNFKLPNPGLALRQPTGDTLDGEDGSSMDKIRPLQKSRGFTKSCDTLTSLTSLLTDPATRDADTESVVSTDPSVSHTSSTRHDSHQSTDRTSVYSANDGDRGNLSPKPLKIASPTFLPYRPSAPSRPGSGARMSLHSVSEEKEVYFPPVPAQPLASVEKEVVVQPNHGLGIAGSEGKIVVTRGSSDDRQADWAKMPVSELDKPFSTLESGSQLFVASRRQSFQPGLSPQTRATALRLLEQHGFSLTAPHDWTYEFFWAASKGHDSITQLLLTDWQYQKPSKLGSLRHRATTEHSRVQVDFCDPRKRTALHLAAIHGQSKVAQALLDAGASCTPRMDGDTSADSATPRRTALEAALAHGFVETVDVFISNGCYDESKDEQGWTLLHQAAFHGHQRLFVAMLNKYPNGVGAQTYAGRTALHLAAQEGRESLVQLLLRRNVDLDARDVDKMTPLFLATAGGHQSCVETLLKSGADARGVDMRELGVLHLAAREGHSSLFPLLIAKGGELEAGDEHMRRPLHHAASNNRLTALQRLLQIGADTRARDRNGCTAMHLASETGHVAIVEALLSSGTDVDLRDKAGMTPLMLSARGGHRGVVMALLPQTAGIDWKDQSGSSALQYADNNEHTAVKKLLQLNGAVG